MKRLVIVSLLCLAPLMATACHTVQGAGKDVTSVGEAMEDAAK